MKITQEATGNKRWFAGGKVVSRYLMFDWLREKELCPSQLTEQLVAEYISWANTREWKWEI